MPPIVVNPEVSLPPRPGDEYLPLEQLGHISLFESLKRMPSVEKYPGTVVLRRYRPGETIVRQGDAGWTAFYILTAADVVALRDGQLIEVQKKRQSLRPENALHDGPRLDSLGDELERELGAWRRRAKASAAAENGRRQVATVLIELNLAPKARRSGFMGRLLKSLTGAPAPEKALPKFIPNDGPADIPLATRRDGMYEGDLFGEMSCMGRVPRSATVVADEECYVLEMSRNILEQVRKDETYRRRMDDVYRRRALGPQLRKLPVFDMLDDAQFDLVRAKTELVSYENGQVIFDEGEPSDAFYVIRGGLVKVVKDLHYLLRAQDLPAAQGHVLAGELAALAEGRGAAATVWGLLDATAQAAVRQAAADPAGSVPSEALAEIERAVNTLIAGHELVGKLGSKRADLPAAVDEPRAEAILETFPEKVKEWNDLNRREFHRWLLEVLCPRGLPKRPWAAKDSRTLTYLGRGDFFGEAGVLLNLPRSATCVAFGHPDCGDGAAPSTVELVRIGISREELEHICQARPALQARFDTQIETYKKRDQAPVESRRAAGAGEITTHPRFEELGLIQGRKLMLIDLDRCTRCGDCVQACIRVHDDGASRLFLDGPRFGKYLIPNACRKCLDPVCMIGCPVGSIVRGGDGEIEIKDWCIGCGLCADNCPYGSIHMNRLVDLELGQLERSPFERGDATPPRPVDEKYETREVRERAVVCDLCGSLASKEPACVYHCPHDAAIRIDARYEFPAM
ncbi:MAG TPA: cyclic nucleotide-binding domain-containing protein [Pirellulales bacterium]|nr:cyclic nucleotide-binding domain-containing protein [Pirellulales bacterium]